MGGNFFPLRCVCLDDPHRDQGDDDQGQGQRGGGFDELDHFVSPFVFRFR
jgi:hypothetical protein